MKYVAHQTKMNRRTKFGKSKRSIQMICLLEKELADLIVAECESKHITKSEFVRHAIAKYFEIDINTLIRGDSNGQETSSKDSTDKERKYQRRARENKREKRPNVTVKL